MSMCGLPSVQLGYGINISVHAAKHAAAQEESNRLQIPKMITLTMACLAILLNIGAALFALRPRKRWIMADVFFFNLFLTSLLWAVSYILNVFMYFHCLTHQTVWDTRMLTINRMVRGSLEVSFIWQIVIMAISRLLAVQCPYFFRNHANRKMGCRVVTFQWLLLVLISCILTVIHAYNPEGIYTQIYVHLHGVYVTAIFLCLIYSYVVYKVISQNSVGGVARRKSQRKWVLLYSIMLSVSFVVSFVPRSIDQLWFGGSLNPLTLYLLPMTCSCFQALIFIGREVSQVKEESRKKTLTFSRSSSHQWEGPLRVTIIANRQTFDTRL